MFSCLKLFDKPWFVSEMHNIHLLVFNLAKDTKAVIALLEGMRLVSGSNTILLSEMSAGSSKKASWKVAIDQPIAGKEVKVTAYGIVSGHVPEARWTGEQKSYPPYDYSDAIGGEMVLTL